MVTRRCESPPIGCENDGRKRYRSRWHRYSASFATIGGGELNQAGGQWSTVPGGQYNTAAGDYSFAAGRRAKANNDGCFVWGDATGADITCAQDNLTIFRSSGGFYIYSKSDLSTGVFLPAGGGSWSLPSDRELKENVAPVDAQALLEKLSAIEVATWNYKAQDESIRHIGPMAQDFYAAFGLGEDDRHISAIDADGVAMAAIQGLYRQNLELQAENDELRARVDELEARMAAMEEVLAETPAAGGER
jgi:hypothetical protein